MSKFRALIVSSLLATALFGGAAVSTDAATAAKTPSAPSLKDGSHWCC